MGNLHAKQKYLEQFKRLYREKCRKEISDAEALEYFESLVALVEVVYKPIPKNKMGNLLDHSKRL